MTPGQYQRNIIFAFRRHPVKGVEVPSRQAARASFFSRFQGSKSKTRLMSPLLAQSGHGSLSSRCPLSGIKRTYRKGANRSTEISWLNFGARASRLHWVRSLLLAQMSGEPINSLREMRKTSDLHWHQCDLALAGQYGYCRNLCWSLTQRLCFGDNWDRLRTTASGQQDWTLGHPFKF